MIPWAIVGTTALCLFRIFSKHAVNACSCRWITRIHKNDNQRIFIGVQFGTKLYWSEEEKFALLLLFSLSEICHEDNLLHRLWLSHADQIVEGTDVPASNLLNRSHLG